MDKMWCGYVMTKADQMKNSTNDSAKEIKIKASDKLKHSGCDGFAEIQMNMMFFSVKSVVNAVSVVVAATATTAALLLLLM